MATNRRRAPRHAADWEARYRLAEHDPWRAARVVDVSSGGAAVELSEVSDDDDLTGELHLEVLAMEGDANGCYLRVSIRRAYQREQGKAFVGIEFAPPPHEGASLLEVISSMGATD